MLSFLCGEIVSLDEGSLVIKSNNIGFNLLVSNSTLSHCSEIGAFVQLHTHLQVKEDGFTLYGFFSAEEKKMFLRLITVSGVGCKMALSIVSNCNLKQLALAILNGDTMSLSSIKGVGKKTAERLVVELREKVSASEAFGAENNFACKSSFAEDAMTALVSLGLSRNEAVQKTKSAVESGCNSAEQILSHALKHV